MIDFTNVIFRYQALPLFSWMLKTGSSLGMIENAIEYNFSYSEANQYRGCIYTYM